MNQRRWLRLFFVFFLGAFPIHAEEPPLPMGLSFSEKQDKPKTAQAKKPFPFDFYGFIEARGGIRTQHDPHEKQASLGEARGQISLEKILEKSSFLITADLVIDPVADRYPIDLEKGEGFLDLREAKWSLRATDFLDLKIGRQILTWGTGDLLFLNDLFPKDFNSFFIGRDQEYLKAPSDAIKTSFFHPLCNVDVVYTPRFDADRFVDGNRLSYYNQNLGRLAGQDAVIRPDWPDRWFRDEEWALRLYQTIKGYEYALYGYHGFWKDPVGSNPETVKPFFPALQAFGASIRGVVYKGIGYMEGAYYRSKQDSKGTNPFIPNSEYRFLAGYEQEIASELTLGLQYYIEWMDDFGALKRHLPAGSLRPDETRHVVTCRLTQLLKNQNLKLSLFTFYSPSDQDAYLRPLIHYKFTDALSGEIGGNVFVAKKESTFFGQFKKNSNIYLGLRYSY